MVLGILDLGAMELFLVWHALAFRSSQAADGRTINRIIMRADWRCFILVDVHSHFSLDLGNSIGRYLHCGDDVYRCSRRPDYHGGTGKSRFTCVIK